MEARTLRRIAHLVCLSWLMVGIAHAQSSLPKITQLKIDAEKGDPKAMVELAFQYQISDKDEMIKWLR